MSEPLVRHITSYSPEETEQIGMHIGTRLQGGEVIELVSDLGGGKTTFVRGLARGMGSSDPVSSPTFTLARVYTASTLTLHHFDFYRLQEAGTIADELAEVLADPHAVAVVEWGDVIRHVLPAHTVTIGIIPISETIRELNLTYHEAMAYAVDGVTLT